MFRFAFSDQHPLSAWSDCITRQLGVASLQCAVGQHHVARMNIDDAARQLREFRASCAQQDVACLLGSLLSARVGASR